MMKKNLNILLLFECTSTYIQLCENNVAFLFFKQKQKITERYSGESASSHRQIL